MMFYEHKYKMTQFPQIKITNADGVPRSTRVFIGNEEVTKYVRSIAFNHDAGSIATVNIEFIIKDGLEIDTVAGVEGTVISTKKLSVTRFLRMIKLLAPWYFYKLKNRIKHDS